MIWYSMCALARSKLVRLCLPHCAHQTNYLALISTPDFAPRVQTQAVSQLKCHIEIVCWVKTVQNKLWAIHLPGQGPGCPCKGHWAPALCTPTHDLGLHDRIVATWIEISQASLRSWSEILIVLKIFPSTILYRKICSVPTLALLPHTASEIEEFVYMQYFAGWKLFLPSASITQWF